MRNKSTATGLPALIGLAVALCGCSQQTLQSAQNDTQHNIAAARLQLAKLELGARVSAALGAANVHGIRVDARTNGVSLHGTVNSAAQKARAAQIARETLGPNKSVNNQIQVSGE